MGKSVCMVLAPGFEEIEALGVVDILRRAGVDVTIAGTVDHTIIGRNDIKVLADAGLGDAVKNLYDMVVLPGGAVGTQNLIDDHRVGALIRKHFDQGRYVAAICAAPLVLSREGLLEGRCVTSHPSVRAQLKARSVSDDRVVVDGTIITSQGPGTAIEFAFKLVELLVGRDMVQEVNQGVLAALIP